MRNELKALLLAPLLIFAAAGCGTVQSSQRYTKFTNDEIQDLRNVDVEINFHNWNANIQEEEKVYITYDWTAYNFISINDNGCTRTYMKDTPGHIMSSYLEDEISIPAVAEGDMLVLDIDYGTKTIDYHTEPIRESPTVPDFPDEDKYYLQIKYLNSTDRIMDEEELTVYYADGTRQSYIFTSINYLILMPKFEGYITSKYLGRQVELPETDLSGDQVFVIEIDYSAGTMTSHIENTK